MIHGLYSALIVPFDGTGEIMDDGLRAVIKHNIERQRVDGLYVNGSTGESFMMSTQQKRHVLELVKTTVGNKLELIAQVGSLDLNEAVELGLFAKKIGYRYLSAITPFYYQFSFDEVKQYYETITSATNLDLLIYALPALTGRTISVAQYDALFENPHIIGVKYSDPNCMTLERLRSRYPDKCIMYGMDEMLMFGLLGGANGAIGSTYNVNGRRARAIMDAMRERRLDDARILQRETNDLIERMMKQGVYQTLKEILRQEGVNAGLNKRPMRSFDTTHREDVAAMIRDFAL